MPLKTRPRTIVDHLGSEAALAADLDACLEDGDPKLVGAALGDIAHAKGITDLAGRTGLPEVELHASLSGEQVPQYATVVKVIAALGLRLGTSRVSARAA